MTFTQLLVLLEAGGAIIALGVGYLWIWLRGANG